jgi:hypothetical protein
MNYFDNVMRNMGTMKKPKMLCSDIGKRGKKEREVHKWNKRREESEEARRFSRWDACKVQQG